MFNIKPLEWKADNRADGLGVEYAINTLVGVGIIRLEIWYPDSCWDYGPTETFDDVESAKDYAETDHRRRVMSYLVPVEEVSSVPNQTA